MFRCSGLQITRLEQNIQQLQLSLASAHQRHKTDTERLEDTITSLQRQLSDAQSRVESLDHEVNRKEEQIKRNEGEILACRDDIKNKVDEVGHAAVNWGDQVATMAA